jgi:preprotein translocase subunit SecG
MASSSAAHRWTNKNRMYRFLVILLTLDALVLAVAVLLQAGKGGGLAASFGGAGSSPNSLLGSREAGNLLTKASWWCGGIFIGLAFILQIMVGKGNAPTSILDSIVQPTAPAGAPTGSQAAPLTPITPPPATGATGPTGKQAPTGKQQ